MRDAVSYAMAGLDGGRLNIAASALGGAQFALESSLTYMNERKAFGKNLNQFQALQFKLADMEVKLQLQEHSYARLHGSLIPKQMMLQNSAQWLSYT